MTILVLGINHKTASVGVREKVAFSDEKRILALQQISEQALGESAVILSTCNRTELYLHNRSISPDICGVENKNWLNKVIRWFAHFHRLTIEQLQPVIYSMQNVQATVHLMRVACGLDSLILGEPQILGQVKLAYNESEQFYANRTLSMSSEFSRLFQKSFACAKRVRSETDIGGSAVSVAYAAMSLSRQIFDSFGELTILLLGAGETIELVSRYLFQQGASNVMIANRTKARAEALSQRVAPMMVLSLDDIQFGLNQADIVISSTASTELLVTTQMVKKAQEKRKYRSMLIIDIAVPRDVEESVGELDAVYHYSVDDLQHIIQQNLAQREQASKQAELIVQQEAEIFFKWLKLYQSSHLIRKYRDNAEQIRLDLLEKAIHSHQQGKDIELVLQELSYKLTNRLLHAPTQAIQQLAKSGNSQGLQQLSSVLGLESYDEREH